MIGRAVAAGTALAAVALTAWAGPYDKRDWAKYPAIVERAQPGTVWEIGDIHGDYERAVRLLLAAGIIPARPATPERAAWSGGDSVLVVTGDMIDKGPRPTDVLRFLRALQMAARAQRGDVIVLAGNHEAELLMPPSGGQSKDRLADWARLEVSPDALRDCRGDVGQFLCSLPFGAKVGEWFFSHAGNTGGRTIKQLSTEIQSGTYDLTDPDSMLEARLGEGKEWISPHGSKTGEKQLLESYAKALGVKHIVQGHQHAAVKFDDGVERKKGEMFQRWGLLFLTDVGMSREIGDSQGAALKITQAGATAVCPDGAETLLWDAKNDAAMGRALCAK
jgi:metallophosphoesterase superfamily enzyme